MIGAAKRYRELLTSLLIERELAGGSLPDEQESLYVEELDRCWWALTSTEQEEVERLTSGERNVIAPSELAEEDVSVSQGARVMPRKAA